jgi:Ni,Fe-hydrogenase III large subunit
MHDFILPVGPQHPALIEPVHMRLKVEGETIVSLEDLQLGYNHKGIEKSLENRTWHKAVFLSERVCGICGNFHTTCFAQGVESLMDTEIPNRAKHIRMVISELERIHSHLLCNGLVAHEMGLDTLFHYIFRDREVAMDLQEMLTGNRVHFSMNQIGGVRRDISDMQTKEMQEKLENFKERMRHYTRVFSKDYAIKRRTKKVGVLTQEKARELCAVGPVARASGLEYDIRKTGYLCYGDMKFRPVMGEGGDVAERITLRFRECLESIDMIQNGLALIPKGEISRKLPLALSIEPGKEVVSRVEAPRGELFYYIRSAGDRPYRVKIRTPTYSNFHVLETILKGYQVADLPVIIASIDPCMSCTDRVTLVKENGKETVVTKEDFHHLNDHIMGNDHSHEGGHPHDH